MSRSLKPLKLPQRPGTNTESVSLRHVFREWCKDFFYFALINIQLKVIKVCLFSFSFSSVGLVQILSQQRWGILKKNSGKTFLRAPLRFLQIFTLQNCCGNLEISRGKFIASNLRYFWKNYAKI